MVVDRGVYDVVLLKEANAVTTTYDLKQGDVLKRLHELPDESVHCVVTSPPYWKLRDYGVEPIVWDGIVECAHKWIGVMRQAERYTGKKKWQHLATIRQAMNRVGANSTLEGGLNTQIEDKAAQIKIRDVDPNAWGHPKKEDTAFCSLCGAWRGCLGLEPTPELYVQHIVQIFREVKRVLRKDGTLWLNLGDSYFASGQGFGDTKTTNKNHNGSRQRQKPEWPDCGLKPKDLVGIPWRCAFALQADGWYLRSDIIWSKPNPMPESVTDRPTGAHEYLFLLSKSRQYFFDQEAVREVATSTDNSVRDRDNTKLNNPPGRTRMNGLVTNGYHYRNVRSVWNIATQPFSGAHFATFPEKLVRRCVLAGTSEKGVCGECGAAWVRVIERSRGLERDRTADEGLPGHMSGHGKSQLSGRLHAQWKTENSDRLAGWQPSCKCAAPAIPATVLDPFSGSGTTGVMANKLGRNFIGIELNPQYVKMAERRLWKVNQQDALFQ